MKRIIGAAAAAALLTMAAACGGGNSENGGNEGAASSPAPSSAASAAPAASPAKGVEVDKGLLNHEITLPASFFEGQELDAAIEAAKKNGVTDVKRNEDGSVTYKMPRSVHGKMMDEMKASLLTSIDELKAGETFQSVKDIEYSKDFSEFTLIVDQAKFEGSFDAFAAIGVALPAMYYRLFDGVPQDENKVTVKMQDQASGEVFQTVVYPDAMEAMGQ
ncbi:hypothetical protein NYE40_20245 [Paenibacillus sp. FSL W8-1187]|uniref:Antigen I/II N-terminal domain-containing protein n=1 Tax=Paenibacillus pasadenensis TaxID=217090 RepID=A0A2N5NB77_9BACL|nr:hypothetical protein [Paenibacillus pasadenensis]PLT47575.1 hypothetical protein B8V81_1799 [Paenibacillus pasadenensis]